MFFAIVQDTATNDNMPFAAHGATEEEVSQQICKRLHDCYEMPKTITTMEAAQAWFGGYTEEDEEQRKDINSYDAVFMWNTEEM